MNETEWNASDDPSAMIRLATGRVSLCCGCIWCDNGDDTVSLASGQTCCRKCDNDTPAEGYRRVASDRKLRLFVCAVSRLIRLADVPSWCRIDAAEEWADGGPVPAHDVFVFEDRDAGKAARGVCEVHYAMAYNGGRAVPDAQRRKAEILRDIVGNPFRPLTLPLRPAPKKLHQCPHCRYPGRYCGVCHGTTKVEAACGDCFDSGRIWVGMDNLKWTPCVKCPKSLPPDWVTPQVITLAKAAYSERAVARWECVRHGTVPESEVYEAEGGGHGHCHPTENCWQSCEVRHAGDGQLDQLTLAAVADALEEAGMPVEVFSVEKKRLGHSCPICGDAGFWRGGQEFDHMKKCRKANCGEVWVPESEAIVKVARPNPVLEHLRSPGPHYRGMWSLDLILGRS